MLKIIMHILVYTAKSLIVGFYVEFFVDFVVHFNHEN